jgi:hypothetical protein
MARPMPLELPVITAVVSESSNRLAAMIFIKMPKNSEFQGELTL